MQSLILQASGETLTHLLEQHAAVPTNHQHVDQFRLEPDPSIGIEAIRELQAYLQLPPLKHPHKLGLILQAELLTHQAQNALLKLLEEPPEYAQIILATNQPDSLLPTVLSRCQLIKPAQPAPNLNHKPETQQLVTQLRQGKTGDRIELASKYKQRDDALAVCQELMLYLRQELLNQRATRTLRNLQTLDRAQTYLRANTNVQLTLEHAFIRLSFD